MVLRTQNDSIRPDQSAALRSLAESSQSFFVIFTSDNLMVSSAEKPKILLLTSSLLTDRILLYTNFLKELAESAHVLVWASSCRIPDLQLVWKSSRANAEPFPEVKPFKEFPYNYLRRLNEFAWDYRLKSASRLSMLRHVREKNMNAFVSALRFPARWMAACGKQEDFEKILEKILLSYSRSPEAEARLKESLPSLVLCMNPFWFSEPAVTAAARKQGIPVVAMIPSWDNLSTKNRMAFHYDAYIVWSETAKEELRHFYPASRNVPVYVVGAPQFDIFFQERFHETREAFCRSQGLQAKQPVILYALGSPNFLPGEYHAALYLARKISSGELGEAQLIIRPHPIHDNGKYQDLFSEFGPSVVIQRTGKAGVAVTERTQDDAQVRLWINTMRHADVVVNFSSTVAIEAAFLDKPIVNLDFDPTPGRPHQELIRDVNHAWDHFKPIAESGGMILAGNEREVLEGVKTYLKHPELHRDKRRWIAERVCGYLDGKCSERMANATSDFLNAYAPKKR